jgi:hypothetical protein
MLGPAFWVRRWLSAALYHETKPVAGFERAAAVLPVNLLQGAIVKVASSLMPSPIPMLECARTRLKFVGIA